MSEPTQPSQNPFIQQAAPKQRPTLPWVIVGVLAVVCGLLAGLFIAQSAELQRLRDAQATPAAPAASASPKAGPQPITDPAALKVLKELPRRVADDPLALGKVDAPVVMTVWTDFRCPFCSLWERETLPKLMGYVDSGSLRIEHRDLAIFGDDSLRTAVGARAAGLQGKFWEFASAVAKAAPTSGHPPIDDAAVTAFAKQAGVADMAKFAASVKDPALTKAVQDDSTFAQQQIGITGTPAFFVNNTPIDGAQPLAIFAQVIESYGGKK